MKRIVLAAATALPLMAGAAFAYTDAPASMVSSVKNMLETSGFADVDVETLTDAQLSSIYITSNSEMSPNEKKNQIESALKQDTKMRAADNASVDSVQLILDRMGYKVDASTLTQSQIAEIYIAANSDGMVSDRQRAIESALPSGTTSTMAADADMNSMTMTVQNILERNGFTEKASDLTDAQIAEIYLAATSGQGNSDIKQIGRASCRERV